MKKITVSMIVSLTVIGIIAGVTGMALTILMHTIQHYAFGYGFAGDISFREIVDHVAPLRRLGVLTACGAVAGVGWVLIHRFGSPLVSIKETVSHPDKPMPLVTTILHSLLQVATVAMGSPLGREMAPREISTAITTRFLRIAHIGQDKETRKLFLACAAGAGLAAIYNVPLASALFILETLLVSWTLLDAGAAFFTCAVAVFVVRFGLGDVIQYPIPAFPITPWFPVWGLAAGPLIAIGVYYFDKSCSALPRIPRSRPIMIVISVAAFAAIGILSMWFPAILGNGKAGNQLSMTDSITWLTALELYGAKWGAILLAMAAGAYGGRITPSMMLGGMAGLVMATIWNLFLPQIPVGSAAFVGAAVYLGLAQKMPVTAVVFLLELTRYSPAYLFPICSCMATALLFYFWLTHRAEYNR